MIEDWNAAEVMRAAVVEAIRTDLASGTDELGASIREAMANAAPTERRQTLTQLPIEFMLARAGSGEAIAEVIVDEFWITVRRGPGHLDPDSFRLDDAYVDYFGLKGW